METTHLVVNCATILHQVLLEYCEVLNRRSDYPSSKLIVSEDHTRYLVLVEGWIEERRIHSLLFDGEIRSHKIWIHHDGLDHGITDDLLNAGISKDAIVLAFHPSDIRQHTGFAVT